MPPLKHMKTAILPLPGQEKANKYHPKQPGGTGEAAVGKRMPGSSRNDLTDTDTSLLMIIKEEAGSFPPPVKQQLDSPAQAHLRRIMRAARPIRLRDAVAGSGTAAAAMALRLASWEALACNVVLSTTRYLT